MKEEKSPEDIQLLILKNIIGRISSDERKSLDAWRQLSEENEAVYQWLSKAEHHEAEYRFRKTVDTLSPRFQMERRIAKLQENETKGAHRLRRFLKYAAAILVLVVAATGLWYKQYTRVTPPEISEAVQLAMQQSMQSGKSDAVIEKEERWAMEESGKGKEDGERAKGNAGKEPSSLIPHPSSLNHYPSSLTPHPSSLTKEQLLTARRITTRHDKEFWLTLDDGTLVHLNYNTRLIYPEHFGRGDRNVVLDGEAYFMVAKDKSRPFIVHTPNGEVKVYGTEFNVNASVDATTVVLVEGAVSVTPANGLEQMMKPNQRTTISNNQISITAVDVTPYVAWNIGKFTFHDWTLDRIMDIIGKWYDKEIVFADPNIRQMRFTGNFDRYDDLRPTLDFMSRATGLDIIIEKDKIIITK